MWRWFKAQNSTVKGMVIFGLLMIVGIIANWGRVSGEVADAFGRLFSKPEQEQVIQDTADENSDN